MLAADLVGYWRFEETSGTMAYDSSGNDLHMTMAGGMSAATATASGVRGNALTFDGATNYMAELTNDPVLRMSQNTSVTLSAWVNLTNNGQFSNIMRYDDLDQADGDNINPRSYLIYGVGIDGSVYFRFGDSAGTNSLLTTAAGSVAYNSWHHVTAVRDVANDRQKIYVDGVLIGDQADASTGTWETTGQYLLLGRYLNGGTSEHFGGRMDDVRFYRRAMTDEEVAVLYQSANYDACNDAPAIGTVCADGSVYAGLSPDGNTPMFTTRTSSTQLIYYQGAFDQSALQSCGPTALTGASTNVPTTEASCNTGRANSNQLLSLGAAQSVNLEPVTYCNNLVAHGKGDWYLPSVTELHQLMVNITPIGGFDTAKTWYWSSSWQTTDRFWQVNKTAQVRYDGAGTFPTTDYGVRCVRRVP